MKIEFDVDIDFPDREVMLKTVDCVYALASNKKQSHPTGVYFQEIPFDPLTKNATIDYKEAEELGYFKLDFLSASVYEDVRDEEHLQALMKTKPMWELLEEEDVVKQLFHVADYGWLLRKKKPTSVLQLAMLLAIIRPAKKHLQDFTWDDIEKTVWDKPTSGEYYFKKAHAISYAVAVVVQLNLIVEQAISGEK